MKKRLFVPMLMTLALLVSVAAWAMKPTIVAHDLTAGTTVSGRVISVDASGHNVTVGMLSDPARLGAVTAGDRVQLQLAEVAGTDGARPSPSTPSRRLLGGGLIAMTGAVIVLRARRARTV
jgi:hypothetical protein